MGCRCGDADCMHYAVGYPWCRPCQEHHRPPECAINEDGMPLAPCGCLWEIALAGAPCPHYDDANDGG